MLFKAKLGTILKHLSLGFFATSRFREVNKKLQTIFFVLRFVEVEEKVKSKFSTFRFGEIEKYKKK